MKNDLLFVLSGVVLTLSVGSIVWAVVAPQPDIVVVPVDSCADAQALRELMPHDANHGFPTEEVK